MHAEEAVFERRQRVPPTIDNWTVEPWQDNFEIEPTIKRVLSLDQDTLEDVLFELSHYNFHPHYPELKVDVVGD